MLEKVIELLLGLAVGAAGLVGLSTAADATASVVAPATAPAAETATWARERAADIRADVEARIDALRAARAGDDTSRVDVDDDATAQGDVEGSDGRATAAAAIEAAHELAPDAAGYGLQNAWEHVTGGDDTAVGADAALNGGVTLRPDRP